MSPPPPPPSNLFFILHHIEQAYTAEGNLRGVRCFAGMPRKRDRWKFWLRFPTDRAILSMLAVDGNGGLKFYSAKQPVPPVPQGVWRIIGKQVRGLCDSVTVCREYAPRRMTAATGKPREGRGARRSASQETCRLPGTGARRGAPGITEFWSAYRLCFSRAEHRGHLLDGRVFFCLTVGWIWAKTIKGGAHI